jgi:hypothetical protein
MGAAGEDDRATRRFPSTTGGGEGFLWFFAVVWFGVLAFFVAKDPGSLCMVVPMGFVGLLPVGLAVASRRSRVRYGGAEFEMLAPGSPGGRLEGVVHVPHAIPADAYIRVTLVCQRHGGADSADPVLWRTQDFVAPLPSPQGGQIPVRIEIPPAPSAPDTSRRYCTLKVYAERGCRGLDLAFELPMSTVEAAG